MWRSILKTCHQQPPPRTHLHPYSAGATFSIRLNTFQLARGFLNEALEVLQAIRTSGYVSTPFRARHCLCTPGACFAN